MIIETLKPSYYAVIFSTIVQDNLDGYLETAKEWNN